MNADKVKAEAAMRVARMKYVHASQLCKMGLCSQSEYQAARDAYEKAKAEAKAIP